MGPFIVRRVLELIPTLLVIVTLTFCLVRFAPGSPFAQEKAMSPEAIKVWEDKYGLNKSLPQQYVLYMGNLLRGNLGPSTRYPDRSVNEILWIGFPVTLQLGLCALVWALLIGIPAGIIGAVRQNTVWDYATMSSAMIGISIPTFVLGPILVLLFSLTVLIFPPGLWGSPRHMVLPAITLGSVYGAYIARLTRGGMLEVVRSDFVRTAHAKGLKERLVIWRHMLKGGLLPVVTFLGPAIASLLVGSVVVEKIFATPGIGPYFVDAAFNRDHNLAAGIVLVYSALLLVMNLIVDIVYGFLDPRIRYE